MPVATVGKKCNFDGTEAVTCVLREGNRNGVQVVASGFNIVDAEVTVISAMGVETLVPPPTPPSGQTEVKHSIIGREGFALKGIRVEGLPPGEYAITFLQ
jgi:hypothetical protein